MELLTLNNLFTLAMLILLQTVLGFDNLLYITLESKRAPAEKRELVRRWGIGIAVALRIVLLFVVIRVIASFQQPLFGFHWADVIEGAVTLHSLIVLAGGAFIVYTATREIWHMLEVNDLEHEERAPKSVREVVFWIVAMNVVFSFDSILSAMALTDVFVVMATAIVIGGVLMIWLSDKVAGFLERNRMYEVLGLFILFVVGVMLITEGGHLAQLAIFGQHITPMTKVTFYFVIFVLVMTDVVQSHYQRKLIERREAA